MESEIIHVEWRVGGISDDGGDAIDPAAAVAAWLRLKCSFSEKITFLREHLDA